MNQVSKPNSCLLVQSITLCQNLNLGRKSSQMSIALGERETKTPTEIPLNLSMFRLPLFRQTNKILWDIRVGELCNETGLSPDQEVHIIHEKIHI